MKKYNVSVPRKYTKDGEEKSTWSSVGRMIYFPAENGKQERYLLELNMFPDTKFGVFADEPRTQTPPQTTTPTYPADEIKPEDIPF